MLHSPFGYVAGNSGSWDRRDLLNDCAPLPDYGLVYGGLAQLARAPALHAGGHRFDSDILHAVFYLQIKGHIARFLCYSKVH